MYHLRNFLYKLAIAFVNITLIFVVTLNLFINAFNKDSECDYLSVYLYHYL